MRQKLIVNRHLDIPNFPQTHGAHVAGWPPHFEPATNSIFKVEQSQKTGGTRHSTVSVGAHAVKVHRTFRWLSYVQGKVTYMPLAGSDILTGKMSGCWIAIFDHGATRYVGHLGTEDDPNTPNSLQVKAAWRNAVNAGHITPVKAFRPTDPPPGVAFNTVYKGTNQASAFYAAVEPNEDVYTVVLCDAVKGTNRKRIATVIPMNGRSHGDVTTF